MSLELVAWIIVPLVLFILPAIAVGIRGAIKFAQYLVKSEEAQRRTADSNDVIVKKLDGYIKDNEEDKREMREDLAVLKFAVIPNGSHKRRMAPESEG